jgi:hypothetical protein
MPEREIRERHASDLTTGDLGKIIVYRSIDSTLIAHGVLYSYEWSLRPGDDAVRGAMLVDARMIEDVHPFDEIIITDEEPVI